LLPAPVSPVTLEELGNVTRLLARAGATIYQLNTLRKHLELMKGGGLAKVAYPAKVNMMVIILLSLKKRQLLTNDQLEDVYATYFPLNFRDIPVIIVSN